MREAVIIYCLRTPVGKAPKGTFRRVRPDDLAAFYVLPQRYSEVSHHGIAESGDPGVSQEAVIIDCLRTPVGKAPKGTFRRARPDDLAAIAVRARLQKYSQVRHDEIEDLILGCAGKPLRN